MSIRYHNFTNRGHFKAMVYGFFSMVAMGLFASQGFANEGKEPFVTKTIKQFSCSDILVSLDKDIVKEAALRLSEIPDWKRLIKVTRKKISHYSDTLNTLEARLVLATEKKEEKKLRKEIRSQKKAIKTSKKFNNASVTNLHNAEKQLKDIQGRIKILKKAKKKNNC